MSNKPKVGVQLQQQGSNVGDLLRAAESLDGIGVDSIWVADHFFPVYGDTEGTSFESFSLLAAMATRTTRAMIGPLVAGAPYRNPNLTADMARTIDHLSDGRFILGMGSGWFARDFDEYGYEFGTAIERLTTLERDLVTIRSRMAVLNPGPVGRVPVLVGGSGRKVTLRLVAEHADMWNTFGPPDTYRDLCRVLDEWCERIGRDPATVERTVAMSTTEIDAWEDYVDAGATHVIVMLPHPHDLSAVEELLGRVAAAS